MSQAKKKMMRRKLAQAVQYQQKCIDNLLELRELFTEFHPEWDDFFTSICNMCMMTIGFMKDLAIRAWGYFPEKLETWLK